MIIEPVKNTVIITFVEDITNERFINKSSSIVISSEDQAQTKYPRWAKVEAVGPDVSDIDVGEFVLVEPGKWTQHFYVDGRRYWKTDDDQLLLVSEEPGTTY